MWKWLYPGMRIKRWLFLILIGFIFLISGVITVFKLDIMDYILGIISNFIPEFAGIQSNTLCTIIGFLFIGLGIYLIFLSLSGITSKISKHFSTEDKLVDVIYEDRVLEKGPEIVALGGGTGLSNLLRGIKEYTSNITAIVTVADDGGSSGKLRDELGMLPPGDIRNCLVALADREPLMEKLFQYRFSDEGHLVGHSFGNLFIASMTEVLGDFEEAIRESSKVLAIKGQVLPATNEDVHLGAVYSDNSIRMGESVIPRQEKRIDRVFLKPAGCQPTEAALNAIRSARVIAVGPGSLYTSILPNLLIEGIVEAIKDSEAAKIYICNVMTQPGETTGYTASDHLQALIDHIGENIFDYIIVNSEAETGNSNIVRRYKEEGAYPVKIDREDIKNMGVKIIEEKLLASKDFIRHDPHQLARVILALIEGDN